MLSHSLMPPPPTHSPQARVAAAVPANPWRVQNGALFGRLDAFMARCQDVLELCNAGQEVRCLAEVAAVLCDGRQRAGESLRRHINAPNTSPLLQFNRLERIDIGGGRGRLLTANVRVIHADFAAATARFHQAQVRGAVGLGRRGGS